MARSISGYTTSGSAELRGDIADRATVWAIRLLIVAGVVREVLESAIKMARMALSSLGIEDDEIARTEDMYRARDKERLKAQVEAGDVRAAVDRVITQPLRGEEGSV